MSTAALDNSIILIKPSHMLWNYISKLDNSDDMPKGITSICGKNTTGRSHCIEHKLLTNQADSDYIQSLNVFGEASINFHPNQSTCTTDVDKLLNLTDLHWLHDRMAAENVVNADKVYFHEVFQGSEILLPKNKEIPRNPELERRCQRLKTQQANQRYKNMTKNVDSVRYNHPEDTIAYQMKQINTHLVAIVQFIVSVLAGFAFGFLGIELMIGHLDFGFRLLLGIICALVIALAELYFLAKKLNEDLEIEFGTDARTKLKDKVD